MRDMPAMKESFSGMQPSSAQTFLGCVRMSMPKMQAVPENGWWKPSSGMRVDFPAPLGPWSPMARLVRAPFSFLRMGRSPNQTFKLANSITGGKCL